MDIFDKNNTIKAKKEIGKYETRPKKRKGFL